MPREALMTRNAALLAALLGCLSCGFVPAAEGTFPQMSGFGGRVLNPLRVVTITTPGDPMAAELASFGSAAVQSAWWQSIATEYALGDPAPSVAATGPDLPSANVSGADMIKYIGDLITAGGAPKPDGNTVYVLFLPDGVVVDDPSFGLNTNCNILKGYHNPFDTNGDDFAAIQRCVTQAGSAQLDDATTTASHEIAEAATDPNIGQGWAEPAPSDPPWTSSPWLVLSSGEIADLCEGNYTREGTFLYQRVWSNHAAATDQDPCIPLVSTPYFNVSPDNPWYPLAAGASVAINLTGWSTAKTDDWEIIAGQVGTSDPTIQFGIQLTSPTRQLIAGGMYETLNNGRDATLTITAPSDADPNTIMVVDVRSFRESIVVTIPANGVIDGDLWHDNYVGVYIQ